MQQNALVLNGKGSHDIARVYHPIVAELPNLESLSELGVDQMDQIKDLIDRVFVSHDRLEDAMSKLSDQFRATNQDIYERIGRLDERVMANAEGLAEMRKALTNQSPIRVAPALPPREEHQTPSEPENPTFKALLRDAMKSKWFWPAVIAFMYCAGNFPPFTALVTAILKKLGWI